MADRSLALACSRASDLVHDMKRSPDAPFITSPKTTKPEFPSALEKAVLSGSPKPTATAIQGLGLRDGFKLFALPGIDRIDSVNQLDYLSRKRLELTQRAADTKGWATYIVRVRAVYFDHLRSNSASILAQFEDGVFGFLRHLGARNLGATQEAGNSDFQIMSVSDLDGTDVIPPYDEFGEEPRLCFQPSHRFLQADFFQRHHLDEPEEHRLDDGTSLMRWTWSRDAVLLISQAKVWDLLAPTIRPFFFADKVIGTGYQRHCDDDALGTLAAHFFSNALRSSGPDRNKAHHANACAAVYLIMQAIPSDGTDMGLLVSALTFSYVSDEGGLFSYVSAHSGDDLGKITDPVAAVRELAPFLADGPTGLLEAFAAESLNRSIHTLKDIKSRLEAVKSFPQDLLPINTTAPLHRDALTVVLGANKWGVMTQNHVVQSIFQSVWTFRHGEALADAIVAYGSGSKFKKKVLMHSTWLDDYSGPPLLTPSIMGFITRLGQKPIGESEADEVARRLLQAKVAGTFIGLATEDYFDQTFKEALPEDILAAPESVSEFEDCGDNMDPTHLALFVSEVGSFSTEEELRALLMNLTPGCLRRISQEDFEDFQGLWLPFWSCLVNMQGAPLQAYEYKFCENMETYHENLEYRFKSLGLHPQWVLRSAGSPNRVLEPNTAASDTPDLEIYDWVTDPNSPAGLTVTRSLGCIEKYHGLHGEYLSSHVTPIPGTDKAQLLMVKRLPSRGCPGWTSDRFKPTIRAELELRLFTQFRPMLRVFSDTHQSMMIGHSLKLDRDTSELSADYLEKWNVPSGEVLELPGDMDSDTEDSESYSESGSDSEAEDAESDDEDVTAALPVDERHQAQVCTGGEADELPRGVKRRATSVVEPDGGRHRRFRADE